MFLISFGEMNWLAKLLISLFSGNSISLVHTWKCKLYSGVSLYNEMMVLPSNKNIVYSIVLKCSIDVG